LHYLRIFKQTCNLVFFQDATEGLPVKPINR